MLNWFSGNIDVIFLLYGLTYVIIAAVILAHDTKHSECGFADILWLFASYAILHAPGDFINIFSTISGKVNSTVQQIGAIATYFSYGFLFEFGRRLLRMSFPDVSLLSPLSLPVLSVIILTGVMFFGNLRETIDVLIGYLVRFPGGMMAGLGIIMYSQRLPEREKLQNAAGYFYAFAIALMLWSFFCGIVRLNGFLFPSNFINIESFFRFTHIPVYVFRSLCGCIAAVSIVGILNFFNQKKQERLSEAFENERNARNYLSKVISGITDPLVVSDPDGIITLVNNALVTVIGYDKEKLRGMHISALMFPDDRKADIVTAIRKRGLFEGEVYFSTSAGDAIPAVCSITPIVNEKDGSVDGYIGIAKETSVRKRIEAALNLMAPAIDGTPWFAAQNGLPNDLFIVENIKRNAADLALLDSYIFLQSIIDSVNDEVIVRNRNNEVIMMNQAAKLRILRYNQYEACCINRLDGSSFPCDECGTGNVVAAIAKSGKTVCFERIFTLGEEKRIYEVSASPLHGEGGAFIGIAETSRDITERRLLELDVLNAYEQERQRIGQELHDDLLQNLIGIDVLVKMASASLSQRCANDVSLEDLQKKLKKITEFLGNVISRTRSLARGLYPADFGEDGFVPLMRQLVDEIDDTYGIECVASFAEESFNLPAYTLRHLYYIVREAVTNSAKHSNAGRIMLMFEMENNILTITVRDDGEGFGVVARCVDGLGLRIMKYRADVIGARLILDSSPEGTVVTCMIPVPLK